MKAAMKIILYILSFVLITQTNYAQDQKKNTAEPAEIKTLIESRHFEFVAQSANPLRGRTIYLSPGYSLTVSPDTIESYLPYYGRAYQATLDPDDAGIKFTSTDFTYTVKERKRGWEIAVEPKDVQHSYRLSLTISATGSTSIRINSVHRQSISFMGHIRKVTSK
jgi:hypothetical protein